jgi:hypothetical protein
VGQQVIPQHRRRTDVRGEEVLEQARGRDRHVALAQRVDDARHEGRVALFDRLERAVQRQNVGVGGARRRGDLVARGQLRRDALVERRERAEVAVRRRRRLQRGAARDLLLDAIRQLDVRALRRFYQIGVLRVFDQLLQRPRRRRHASFHGSRRCATNGEHCSHGVCGPDTSVQR